MMMKISDIVQYLNNVKLQLNKKIEKKKMVANSFLTYLTVLLKTLNSITIIL